MRTMDQIAARAIGLRARVSLGEIIEAVTVEGPDFVFEVISALEEDVADCDFAKRLRDHFTKVVAESDVPEDGISVASYGFQIKSGKLDGDQQIRCWARGNYGGASLAEAIYEIPDGTPLAQAVAEAQEYTDELLALEAEGGWMVVDDDRRGILS